MAMADLTRVTQSFRDQGYCILEDFLDPEIPALVQREIETWVDRQAGHLRAEGITQSLFAEEGFRTRLLRLVEASPAVGAAWRTDDLHVPGFFPLFFHSGLLDIVEAILGEEIRLYPNYTVRPKLPFDGPKSLWRGTAVWHQDAAYMPARTGGAGMMNVWTALVPARPENGCMRFVPGSHKFGVVPHEERTDYLAIPEDTIRPHQDRAIQVIVDPGDVVIFSSMLFHTGGVNQTEEIRWSCDWRYQDARQSTMRGQRGYLARSRSKPEEVVRSAAQWTAACGAGRGAAGAAPLPYSY
jgi:ectoine hydroxylase-related dioxygenase (phytanoyl-CoA dioxygenase family)